MLSGHSFLIVITVECNVQIMFGLEFLHHLVDIFHSFDASSHRLCRKVGVATGAIPVREKLWGEGNIDVVVFSDSCKKITRHHQVVTHLDAKAWTNLVLPLTWHHFSISS